MMLKSPSAGSSRGSGRDVIFKLTVQPDPRAAAITKQFGDQIVREHNRIAGVATLRAKDFGDAYAKAAADASTTMAAFSAKGTQAVNRMADTATLRAGDFVRAWTSATNQVAARMNGLHGARGGMGGFADTVYGGPSGSAPVGGGGIAGGNGGGGISNFGGALNNLVNGGANIARGVAYSGLVGEQDSQAVLNTLLRMEGLLALIHGGSAIGRGMGGLGMLGGGGSAAAVGTPIAAFVAAVAGAALAINGVREQITGQANNPNSQSGRIASGWATVGAWDYRIGRSLFGKGYSGGERGLVESGERLTSQEKYLADRAKRSQGDAAEASGMFAGNDRASALRRRGSRGDAAEFGNLGADLLDRQRELAFLAEREREAQRQNSVGLQVATRQREEAETRVAEVLNKQRDILEGQRATVLGMGIARSENAASTARSAYDAQSGIARSAASSIRSDHAKFGSLSAIEQMRTKAAFLAVRSGRATREQEALAGGYNEYSDSVNAAQAQRGQMEGAGFFDRGLGDAGRSVAELASRGEQLKQAKIGVDFQHVLLIEFNETKGLSQAMERQLLELGKEISAKAERDMKEGLDTIRREMNGQQRARQAIAGR